MKNNTIRAAIISRAAIIGLATAIPLTAFATGRITGLSVTKVGNGVSVLIQGSGLSQPVPSLNPDGLGYALDFDAMFLGKSEKLQIWQNSLQVIQTSVIAKLPPKARIKFSFGRQTNALLRKEASGYSVLFEESPWNQDSKMDFARMNGGARSGQFGLLPLPNPAASTPSMSAAQKFASSSDAKTKVKPKKTNESPMVFSSDSKATVKKDSEPKVSLDFVNTEVVHILKSLALQTRVNIVTSPDVTGKLSVKLNNVTVKEAISLVTSLTGLKYAQVGKTYVVTSQAKFIETLRSVEGPKEEVTLSRVIPIYSGQGNQIKVAVLKSVLMENAYGRFELVLPSEKVTASLEKSTGGEKGDKEEAKMKTETQQSSTDTYMMAIGAPGRLDEVEQLVKGIDRQLCQALGVIVRENNSPIFETYSVHGTRASDLVDALAGKGKTQLGSVEFFATPPNSIAKQVIVLKGREDEVRSIIRAFEQLDSDSLSLATEFAAVDLKYRDPRSVREMLVSGVPGLSVTIAPASVGNPRVYTPQQTRTMSEERGTEQPAPQGGGSQMAQGNGANQGGQQGAQQGNAVDPVAKTESKDQGLILPHIDMETVGMPMRLILRGTKEQIEKAHQYIKVLDTAPMQAVLELRAMEITREELTRLGVDWNVFTGGAIKFIRMANLQTDPSNTIGVGINSGGIGGDVTATLDAITNNSNLISRPNLFVSDGRANEVFVGDAIRYIEAIISGQNGINVTTGTVRTGVRLSVFPRISQEGSMTLDVQTAVTYLRGFKQVPQIGGELPQTSERVNQQTVTMNDGETFAIGGLIQQQDRVNLSGVPILKDLPVLGQFFRKTSIDKVKSELVIFVTVKIVKPNDPSTKVLPMRLPDVEQPVMTDKAAKLLSQPNVKEIKKTGTKKSGK